MRSVLGAVGPVRTVDEEMGTIEIEVAIGDGNASPALKRLLRALARDPVSSPGGGVLSAHGQVNSDT